MRTKTTAWTRRLAVVVTTAALGVLISASVSSAAPAHHSHAAVSPGSTQSVTFQLDDATWA